MERDPNADLIGRVARRPAAEMSEPVAALPPTEAVTLVAALTAEVGWNDPIDEPMADAMTQSEVIKGIVWQYKEAARRWVPRPMPADWRGE